MRRKHDPSLSIFFRRRAPGGIVYQPFLHLPEICLAAAPTAVYAGGAGSLYKSTDGGATWTTIGSAFGYNIWTIAIDPTNPAIIYVGGDLGVFKTVDGRRELERNQ